MRLCARLTVLFAFISCTSLPTSAFEAEEVVVTGFDYSGNRAKQFCRDLLLTAQEARSYFQIAEPIDSSKAHHEVDYFSCWFEGSLTHAGETCTWQIDIGGLAQVNCGLKDYLLYCKECAENLMDKVP